MAIGRYDNEAIKKEPINAKDPRRPASKPNPETGVVIPRTATVLGDTQRRREDLMNASTIEDHAKAGFPGYESMTPKQQDFIKQIVEAKINNLSDSLKQGFIQEAPQHGFTSLQISNYFRNQ